MQLVKLEHITHAYGNHQVFEDLNLSFPKNKTTCLLGSSGSGKTTLLRLIAGLETPQKGKIILNGQPVSSEQKMIVPPHKRKLGYIFQDLALWPHMTVYENMAFGLKQQGFSGAHERIVRMSKRFGLEAHWAKYPHQLSGGQQQLLALARALVLEPKILLMDEPLANIDVKLKHDIIDLLLQLKKEISIIYVTHDHREAFKLGDEIVVLNRGKIEAQGSPEDIKNSDNEYVRYFLEY